MKQSVSPRLRGLLDRRLTLVTTTLAAMSLLAMLFVPQRVTGDAVASSALVRLLGLDSVVASWWFRVLIAVAALQLATVTAMVARRDIRRLARARGPASREGFAVLDSGALARTLRSSGYLRTRHTAATARYIKHADKRLPVEASPFWSFAKLRLRQLRGVPASHFPLYLKEWELRYNARNEDLIPVLAQALCSFVPRPAS